jgi:phage shock protein C
MATNFGSTGFREEDDMDRGRKFHLNRREGKWWGVCAGIADFTAVDVTLVRVGLVVLTLVGGFPWTLLAYAGVAWAAKDETAGSHAAERQAGEVGMLNGDPGPQRDIDRRIAEVDSFVAHSSSRLNREFEELR